MSNMEKVATDVYTFEKLRKNGFTYVDKTDELYVMASGDLGNQFFIARSRRFGKSLAVPTLKSLFQGERERIRGNDPLHPFGDSSEKENLIIEQGEK